MTANRGKFAALFVACVAAFTLMLPANAHAQQIGNGKNIGIGLAGGNLLGSVTGKVYLDQKSAIQGFLGAYYGYYGTAGIGLSADYVYEFTTLANPSPGRLFLGAGGGGGFINVNGPGFNASWITINGVFELGWHFTEFPLELVIDVRPTFAFGSAGFGPYYSDSAFGIGSSGAFRFYF